MKISNSRRNTEPLIFFKNKKIFLFSPKIFQYEDLSFVSLYILMISCVT